MKLPRQFPITFGCLLIAYLAAPALAQPARNAPPPQSETLVTKDGVQLAVTYFPHFLSVQRKGTAEAKQVTPVVLLHDYKETRAVFNSLAQRLQTGGDGQQKGPAFAVVTVDLRAHGESTKQFLPNGSQVDLDPTKLKKGDLLAMAAYDMEAVRSFLVGKNDAGELNLNKLCLIGAGMGAAVAANWASQDWSAPPLAIGKQGQDVKALVLISPRWSHNGLSFQGPMKFRALKDRLAWMLIYGAEDDRGRSDAQRIHKQLERYHPEPTGGAAQRTGSLQLAAWPESNLQGNTLLRQVGAPLEQQIVNFLAEQVAKKDYPWISRRNR